MQKDKNIAKVRALVIFFIIALVLSGITAFPLEWEISLLRKASGGEWLPNYFIPLKSWIDYVYEGVASTNQHYPFLAYGTDWLAFAHIVIAILFIGVFIDPVKNKWLVYWGIIVCVLILPLAFICGHIRGIPFFWQLIDCSFGVFGTVPLLLCLHYIRKIENRVQV